MRFSSVSTVSFRNLQNETAAVDARDVFLVGENGQGKTNFLEALYFCSFAASFRGARDGELITFQQNACAVSAEIAGGIVPQKINVKLENGVKSAAIDGKKIDDRKSLLSIVPCIVFCHEDMDFVTGSPERRRWFFDQNRSLYDIQYLDDLRRYRKVLKMKNAALKNAQFSPDKGVLDALDPQLAEYGLKLIEKRAEEAGKFSVLFTSLYGSITEIEGVEVRYAPSWAEAEMDAVLRKLRADRPREIAAGVSLSGPHRDRYAFLCGAKNFVQTASTGQRRLLALLLRVCQIVRYNEVVGHCPVLLFDDVLLELDGAKRTRFLSLMPEYEQAFFTFLPDEPLGRYQKHNSLIFDVSGGALTPRETGAL